jgi:hypothetical protein
VRCFPGLSQECGSHCIQIPSKGIGRHEQREGWIFGVGDTLTRMGLRDGDAVAGNFDSQVIDLTHDATHAMMQPPLGGGLRRKFVRKDSGLGERGLAFPCAFHNVFGFGKKIAA